MDISSLSVASIPQLRIALIGVGVRDIKAVKRYLQLRVQIVAIAEMDEEAMQKVRALTAHLPVQPAYYTTPDDWQKLCEHPDISLLYISAPWQQHASTAIYAMQRGKHIAIEVPLAMTIADCKRIVRTAEEAQRHCMMLENVCYDHFELMSIELVKQGRLGESVHAEGVYIHDL